MIKIGLAGYGNLGIGAAKAVAAAPDMELAAIFSRRAPDDIKNLSNVPTYSIKAAKSFINDIDVMLLCGGSKTDLPEQAPYFASMFNTVDSYDTHSKIPEYIKTVDDAAKKTTAVISAGWDPGLFSIMRSLFKSTIPDSETYTFYGKGYSQGHSDAIRRIEGVSFAAQYTIPVESALNAVKNGEKPKLTPREKMRRECFVVLKPGFDEAKIRNIVITMPDYYADYDTTVNFIDEAEFNKNHLKMFHGGMVLTNGNTGENNHKMEFSLSLDSNPDFTGSIMVMYARAAYKMAKEGLFGAKTVFDIPVCYLSHEERDLLISDLL